MRLKDLKYLVFMATEDVREAIDQDGKAPLHLYPLGWDYIEWDGKQNYPTTPSAKAKGGGFCGRKPALVNVN